MCHLKNCHNLRSFSCTGIQQIFRKYFQLSLLLSMLDTFKHHLLFWYGTKSQWQGTSQEEDIELVWWFGKVEICVEPLSESIGVHCICYFILLCPFVRCKKHTETAIFLRNLRELSTQITVKVNESQGSGSIRPLDNINQNIQNKTKDSSILYCSVPYIRD